MVACMVLALVITLLCSPMSFGGALVAFSRVSNCAANTVLVSFVGALAAFRGAFPCAVPALVVVRFLQSWRRCKTN